MYAYIKQVLADALLHVLWQLGQRNGFLAVFKSDHVE